MSTDYTRPVMVLSGVALAMGLIALIASSGAAFAGPEGALLPVQLGFYSPLGAIMTLALGAIALLGGVSREPVIVVVAGLGFLAAAGLVLVQAGASTNWLGGRGSTMSFFLAVGVGLLVLALASRTVPPPTTIKAQR